MGVGGSNGHATSGNACTAQHDRQDKQRQSCDVGWCPSLLVLEADVLCLCMMLVDCIQVTCAGVFGADTMALLSEWSACVTPQLW